MWGFGRRREERSSRYERTSEAPLDALRARKREAAEEADVEGRYGKWSGRAHFFFGIMGIMGGAVAAAAAADKSTTLAVAAGVLAAVGSGAGTFFRFGQRAEWHFGSEATLRNVANLAENRYACLRESKASTDRAEKALEEVQRRLAARSGRGHSATPLPAERAHTTTRRRAAHDLRRGRASRRWR